MKTRVPQSLLFSWHWNKPEFNEQWNFLTGKNSAAEHCETIWKTNFKEVQVLTVPSDRGKYRIALKHYREKRFFRYFLRPSLAAREAAGFAVVESLGIPAANVLAYGEKRKFFNLVDAYFVTEFEENTETLLDLVENKENDNKILLELLKENIRYLAKLHAAGYTHGGAHPRNFLWRKNADGTLESIWIDLATLRKPASGRKYWKYLLTDLSDFAEYFRLSQEDLDMLIAEYRKINDIPAAYRLCSNKGHKLSEAFRKI